MWAVQEEHVAVVQSLLARGASVHAHPDASWSAMTIAIRKENAEIARLLLDAGAEVPPAVGVSNQTMAAILEEYQVEYF